QELQAARDGLLAVVGQVGQQGWAKQTAVPGWTVRDVLAHLSANQPSQPVLIRNILEGKGGSRPDFDLDYYNRRQLEKRQGKGVEELKAELAAGHEDTLKLLDQLSEADLGKRGRHPRSGDSTVADIFRVIALHDQEHTDHIREALK
ncbi:MAG: DinB family protein, partial [Chloroflexi bacterium]|nr:DinB family protein [Chloroflexota bacterium]